MKIFYRVSPFLSSHPNPLGADKKKIVYECFNSFKKNITDQEVTIISDNVPTDWYELFRSFNVLKSKTGNVATFHRQLEEVFKLDDEEKVFLVEDDYLWTKGSIEKIERALDYVDLVSPYDHPGHYIEDRFKNEPKRMILIDTQTYREAPSNTLTFACRAKIIKNNVRVIKRFGINDHGMFQELQRLGTIMYVPVPSLATHLVEGLLAPNVEWNV